MNNPDNEYEMNNDDNVNTNANGARDINVHVHLHDEEQVETLVAEEMVVEPTVAEEVKEVRSIDLDDLIITHFKGRVVRKDLTKQLKEGANVPVYVLEYLLGMYCSSSEDDLIEAGLIRVKKILTDNYVRPDEAVL